MATSKSTWPSFQARMDGTKPITDRDSKMVMLRAERNDVIQIVEFLHQRDPEQLLPTEYEIQQRVSTFYGTELLLEPPDEPPREKYLLTAPGPNQFLYLWSSETNSDGYREGWTISAEIKADFSDDLPRYPICDTCGEPIKSLEHERRSALNNC